MKSVWHPISPFWASALLGILLAAPAACSGVKAENERLKAEITDVSTENEKLKKDLNVLRSENASMHLRLAQLNMQISSLQSDLQNLEKDLYFFKGQVKGTGKNRKD